MKVVLWNTQWASPRSHRGKIIRQEIAAADPDLVCLTEAVPELLPAGGDLLSPGDLPNYPRKDGGEKVLLWSRWGWDDATTVLAGAPGGRFTEGFTGNGRRLRVTGVCIPWHESGVRTAEATKARWEDHLTYLDALAQREARHAPGPAILLGDFNQRIPRYWQPKRVFERLGALLDRREVVTEGWSEPAEALIDHVALLGGLTGSVERVWPKVMDGVRLSDHVGVGVGVAHPATDRVEETHHGSRT